MSQLVTFTLQKLVSKPRVEAVIILCFNGSAGIIYTVHCSRGAGPGLTYPSIDLLPICGGEKQRPQNRKTRPELSQDSVTGH